MAAIGRFNKTNMHVLFRTALKIIKQRRKGGVSAVDVTKNVEALANSLRCLDPFRWTPNVSRSGLQADRRRTARDWTDGAIDFTTIEA